LGAEDELLDAIEAILAGQQYLGQELYSRVQALDPQRDALFPELTCRESDIARDLLKGLDPVEIAHQFNMARKTAYAHRRNLLDKLKLRNETELLALAHERGYVEGIGVRDTR